MFATLKRMGQGKKAGGGHGVAGIGVQAAYVYAHLTGSDGHDHRYQDADHEDGRHTARHQVKLIEKTAHAYLSARYVSITFCPSGPAFLIHSVSMVSPTLSSPCISS